MSGLVIRNVKTICTAPAGENLLIVKVETNEPGLYGLGCATFTVRYLAVRTIIDEYMKPLLTGKDPQRIEDIWQMSMGSAYCRNGTTLNNAISGVDMALWDIKGKLAGMPLYQLLGGKCREAAAVYCHVDGSDEYEVEENLRSKLAEGFQYVRCQMGGYGGKNQKITSPDDSQPGVYYDPAAYMRSIPRLFEHLRNAVGYEPELLHDIHERLQPIDAIGLAKQLEQARLFFLEDVLPPEQEMWLEMLRKQCATPIAMGELFNNPSEWTPLVTGRIIDYVRMHVSHIGGITSARKAAVLCESFGVRTAWHGPGSVSPVGHAANLHLDLSCPNFGIQELELGKLTNEKMQEVFSGCPELRKGYLYPNDRPGLGIDLDEEKAAKYPCIDKLLQWTMTRTPDGTYVKP